MVFEQHSFVHIIQKHIEPDVWDRSCIYRQAGVSLVWIDGQKHWKLASGVVFRSFFVLGFRGFLWDIEVLMIRYHRLRLLGIYRDKIEG